MINKLGGIRQLALVVKDAGSTMLTLSKTFGIGPFFVVRNMIPDDFRFRGRPARAPILTLGFAQAGPLQIEVIQQHNDAPSAYTEFLAAGSEGCQHVGVWFSDSAAYTAARQMIFDSGLVLVHENGADAAVARFAYFATGIPGGLMLEIAEAQIPRVKNIFETVASAAVDWDGRDPIRTFTT
jgi:hypothetical protein